MWVRATQPYAPCGHSPWSSPRLSACLKTGTLALVTSPEEYADASVIPKGIRLGSGPAQNAALDAEVGRQLTPEEIARLAHPD